MDFKSDARHIAGENSSLVLDQHHILNGLTKTKTGEKCDNEEKNIAPKDGGARLCEISYKSELTNVKEKK